jgi:uncharacterized protein (DUF1697 family)
MQDMPTVICLLRGVNLGGHNRIKIDALKDLCRSLKVSDPQTYVQSGNVVFGTTEKDLAKLALRIEAAIEKQFGFRPPVILRTAGEWRDVIKRNPFAKRRDIEPSKLLVLFMASEPDPEGCKHVAGFKYPEEIRISGREVYVYFPNGAGKSKLPWSSMDKWLKTPATGRNWNSVLNLMEMAASEVA